MRYSGYIGNEKLGNSTTGTGERRVPSAWGQTTITSSPRACSWSIRFSVRFTTPSILGRKTSAMIATFMRYLLEFSCQRDHHAVMVLDGEEQRVHERLGHRAGLVQAEAFQERRQPAAE